MATSQVAAVVWKEWRETFRLGRAMRSTSFRFLLLVVFASILGWRQGQAFGRDFSTVILLAEFTVLATFPVVTDVFAGEKERHTLETLLASSASERDILLGKFLAILLFGVGFACLACLVEVATVLARFGASSLSGMSLSLILSGLLVGAASGAVLTSLGVVFSLHSNTVRTANQLFAYTIVGLLFATTSAVRSLPATWVATVSDWRMHTPAAIQVLAVVAIMTGLSAIILGIGLATFKRAVAGKPQ
jgi:ABC-2 type transport system permease protein